MRPIFKSFFIVLLSSSLLYFSCSKTSSSSGTTTGTTTGTTSGTTTGTTSGTTTGNNNGAAAQTFSLFGRIHNVYYVTAASASGYWAMTALGGSSVLSSDTSTCIIYFAAQPTTNGSFTLGNVPTSLTGTQASVVLTVNHNGNIETWISQDGSANLSVSGATVKVTYTNVDFAKAGTNTPTYKGSGSIQVN